MSTCLHSGHLIKNFLKNLQISGHGGVCRFGLATLVQHIPCTDSVLHVPNDAHNLKFHSGQRLVVAFHVLLLFCVFYAGKSNLVIPISQTFNIEKLRNRTFLTFIISNWAVLGKTERILQAERVPRGVAEDFHTEKTGREGSRRISTLKEWPANIHNLFGNNCCHNGFIYIRILANKVNVFLPV